MTVSDAAPVAAPDAASTPHGVAVRVPVLVNDSDANGDTLAVRPGSVTAPVDASGAVRGTVAVVDGDLVHTPPTGFSGVVTFAYVVVANGLESIATVTVTVAAPVVDPAPADGSGGTDPAPGDGTDPAGGSDPSGDVEGQTASRDRLARTGFQVAGSAHRLGARPPPRRHAGAARPPPDARPDRAGVAPRPSAGIARAARSPRDAARRTRSGGYGRGRRSWSSSGRCPVPVPV